MSSKKPTSRTLGSRCDSRANHGTALNPWAARCPRLRCQPVDLRGHDEVVVGKSPRRVGRQRDAHIAPADSKVGVVPLGLGEIADLSCKRECVAEVAELESTANTRLFQLPSGVELLV